MLSVELSSSSEEFSPDCRKSEVCNEITSERMSGSVVQAQSIGHVTVFAPADRATAGRRSGKPVLFVLLGAVVAGLGSWFAVSHWNELTANECWRKYKVVKEGAVRSQDNLTSLGDVRVGDEVRVDSLPEGAKNRRYEVLVLRTQVKGWVVTANLDFEATVCGSDR
jgi:hypothetical protein